MNGRSLLISQQKQGGVLCTRSSGRSRGHAAKQLFDVLEARKQEVETLIHPVKGVRLLLAHPHH
jgi:hypothetical protein